MGGGSTTSSEPTATTVAAGAAETADNPSTGATTSTVATTSAAVAGAATTTTTAAQPETGTTIEVTTTTTTTTTTIPPPPIDERLPRTTAEATETDPVPVGEVIEADPGVWDIALTNVELDATDTVLGFADINPKPEPGYQDVLVTIEGTYLGNNVAEPVFEWAVVAGDKQYLPSIPGCGVVPDSLYDVLEALPGESFTAHICMPVASADVAAGLELYLNAPGDEPRYFSLG